MLRAWAEAFPRCCCRCSAHDGRNGPLRGGDGPRGAANGAGSAVVALVGSGHPVAAAVVTVDVPAQENAAPHANGAGGLAVGQTGLACRALTADANVRAMAGSGEENLRSHAGAGSIGPPRLGLFGELEGDAAAVAGHQ